MSATKVNIISCTEERSGNKPKTLREFGLNRILSRQIKSWMSHFGSYGMGGPGFFELYLEPTDEYPAEHLVLTLWGAGGWLLLNDRWVEAHPNQHDKQRPLYSNIGDEAWDEVSVILNGSVITDAKIEDSHTLITLNKDGVEHLLELPSGTSKLPLHGGSLEPRVWNPEESHWDAWVLTQEDLLC